MTAAPRPTDLAAFDLNLLTVLAAVLRERSAGRAAEALRVTPSAVSHALRRLRDALGDPLFVRGRSGLEATPRAERLAPQVERALAEARAVFLSEARFDPATCERRFAVSSAELGGELLVPRLLAALRAEASAVRLSLLAPTAAVDRDLARGALDFAVGVWASAEPPFAVEPLTRQGLVGVARKRHPYLRRPTLAHWLEAEHLAVAPAGTRGASLLDEALGQRGLSRRVSVEVHQFALTPSLLVESDLLAALPESLARTYAALHGLATFALPVASPRFTLSLRWHARNRDDPAHRWMRALLVASATPRGESAGAPARAPGRSR